MWIIFVRQMIFMKYQALFVPSEDLDLPVHSCSVIRIFAGCSLDGYGYKVSSSWQLRLIRLCRCAVFVGWICQKVRFLKLYFICLPTACSDVSISLNFSFRLVLVLKMKILKSTPTFSRTMWLINPSLTIAGITLLSVTTGLMLSRSGKSKLLISLYLLYTKQLLDWFVYFCFSKGTEYILQIFCYIFTREIISRYLLKSGANSFHLE